MPHHSKLSFRFKGGARHLNVCLPSVYVTTSGAWRLAGFEHIWKSSEVNANLLEISQPFRSKSTTDSDEIRNAGVNLEQYSFAKMCEDILKNQPGSDGESFKYFYMLNVQYFFKSLDPMPYLSEFMKYCSTHLRHKVPQKRPRLSAVLQHPYFNHEFIIIHSFLNELPLKNASEKLDFFTSLIDRLRVFDEFNVAVQLGDLLLSRMVLLDPTAQLHVIPHLLSTRTDSNPQSLFSPDVFIRFIVPRILQLFGVLDAQTRLILLEYFGFFVKFISNADLKDVLLPQLLLGIKDKNDVLVAATLRSLAELVPILGAGVVIGRNRSHVFADGRPQANRDAVNPTATDWMDQQQRSITPVLISNKLLSVSSALLDHVDVSESFASNSMRSHVMPERLSPDGGEDEKTTSDVPDLENDAWSDWEPDHDTTELNVVDSTEVTDLATHLTPEASVINSTPIIVTKTMSPEKPVVEIDFFADMEPVIQKTCTLSIAEPKSTQNQSRLLIQSQSGDALADVSFGGWDDDVDEWGDDG